MTGPASWRVLVVALGSAGDVHPFVPVAQRLRDRGHRPLVIANQAFGDVLAAAGLEHAAAGEEELFRRLTEDAEIWHPRKGPRKIFAQTVVRLPEAVAMLRQRVEPGRTVMVGSSLALAARLVQEADGVPLATAHLAPAVLRSVHRAPRLAGAPLGDRLPRVWKRMVWRLADRLVAPWLERPLNQVRSGLGLPAVSRPLAAWWHSPQLVLGLFPDWFAPRQPDWPPQLELVGFPLWDEAEQRQVDRELERFLEAGPPPFLFTAGSAQRHGQRYFAVALEACRRLEARALLLTSHREDLPEILPLTALHRAYAPFSRVFPRAAAVAHHGGIGTTAQALAAGVPQLVVPWAHDQHDNASRVVDLGVGRALPVGRASASRMARALRAVTAPEVRQRAEALAPQVREDDAVGRAVAAIEELAERTLGAGAGASRPT